MEEQGMKSNEINVEVLMDWDNSGLTKKVNAWLNYHTVEVVDIKYQLAADGMHNYLSAMIIYKK